ncbi:transglycosylase domain-containing protein [Tateyamaria omphalii]|uniref:Glycosyl transferase n=1 Tax=Tateyamaria omphalii TaxID=299262 RepID=A0A1P8MYQ0_9RHOB|nr:transglycosylase domain-containing protein [Tateyamaria omphalii]APX13215.1 glycosyl transferase [Tateyamaria omphalii]
MRRAFKIAVSLLLLLGAGVFGYGAFGYWDAVRKSDEFAARADALIAEGMGPDGLGVERLRPLILVQDPGFLDHGGVDLSTAGAGLTTISQSLSKRLGFEEFRPGIGKIRQTGFAIGLEDRLNKVQILALWLDTVEMGRGPEGWMTGFFQASESIYGRALGELNNQEYHRLLAVLIAPGQFRLLEADGALDERASRISRLLSGDCSPDGQGGVWLDGCA